MIRPVTARQRQVLALIDQSIREEGFPPTTRELGAGLGLRETSYSSAISDHLSRLEEKGLIRVRPHTCRGIVITDAGHAELARGRSAPTP